MNPSGETSLSLQYKLIFIFSFCIIITIVYDNEDCFEFCTTYTDKNYLHKYTFYNS